jgi:hypothetical protein
MAFTLKPTHLETATKADDILKKMKADLKSNLGKKNVKFVAAKNAVIGGKTIQLFIVTDKPADFEAVLKTKQPKAYRAKGTCDIEKDKATGATKVAIKSSTGQMAADAVGRLIPAAFKGDKSFMVTFPGSDKGSLLKDIQAGSTLKKTDTLDKSGVSEADKEQFRRDQLLKGIEKKPALNKTGAPSTGGVSEATKEEYRRDQLLKDIQKKPALKPTAKPQEGGVADWAKERYRRKAQKTLIASMTPDGKIGSVYFGQKGRIRTTHGAGPEKEGHKGEKTVQFNINEKDAIPAFEKENPTLVKSKNYWDHFDQWLVKKLQNVNAKSAPAWAKLVEGPEQAHDLNKGAPPEDLKLFEIFKRVSDDTVKSWHPSRGTATKFVTDKQTVSILEAAIKHIDGQGLTDPGARNREFYNFVKSRLPKFVQFMREPDKV